MSFEVMTSEERKKAGRYILLLLYLAIGVLLLLAGSIFLTVDLLRCPVIDYFSEMAARWNRYALTRDEASFAEFLYLLAPLVLAPVGCLMMFFSLVKMNRARASVPELFFSFSGFFY
jgi:hypothetical protein